MFVVSLVLFSENFSLQHGFFSREASMKSEKREKKNENRKMKTPVYDGEGWKISPSCPI